VIERLLTQELEWDDEPQDDDNSGEEGESLAMHLEGWGWWGGKGDDKKDEGKDKPVRRAVPEAKPEVDCVVSQTCSWYEKVAYSQDVLGLLRLGIW